jgi:hypothetical protein
MWNISMHVFRTLLRILAVALCSLPMDGQTARHRSDRKQRQRPSGALVPCAAAVVYGQATREEHDLTKDADGNFSTPGDYDLTVSRAAGDFENHRC